MSAPGLFRPSAPTNERVLDYAPGSPERAEVKRRLDEMRAQQLEIPLVIGGEEVKTGATFEAVEPHDKKSVPRRFYKGARLRSNCWSRPPARPGRTGTAGPGRSAPLSSLSRRRAVRPWRSTLVAATMLNQSKTAHQAEIDAAAETIDFPVLQRRVHAPIYAEQPSPRLGSGTAWSTARSRASSSQSRHSPSRRSAPTCRARWRDGQHRRLEARLDGRLSAHWAGAEEAGLLPGVINLVYGSGAEVGDAALASEHLAGVHFMGSTPSFKACGRRS